METPAVGQIYALLPKVMDDIGAVGKGRTASMGKAGSYYFRGIDDLYNAVQPALIKHGVTVVPVAMEIIHRENYPRIGNDGKPYGQMLYTILRATYRLHAPDGSYIEGAAVGEAMDTGDKSCNKAMSAAMKYFLMESLCIPTDEPKDSENDTHELPPPSPPASKQPAAKPVAKSLVSEHAAAMQPKIKALAKLWQTTLKLPKLQYSAFVAYAAKVLGVDPKAVDMGNPEMWDDEGIKLVTESLIPKEQVAA
jgi:hypothetical protein